MIRKTRLHYQGLLIFLVNLSHDSLVNYYQTNFSLMQHHHYGLDQLEMMIPWEREVYVSLLTEYIKEENEKIKQKQGEWLN